MNKQSKDKKMTEQKKSPQFSGDSSMRDAMMKMASDEKAHPVGDPAREDAAAPNQEQAEGTKAKRLNPQELKDETKKQEAKNKDNSTGKKEIRNHLREVRIEQMMSKAELARKAGLSVLTIDRIEKGYGSRMDTKRKLLKALGLKLSDRRKVFEDD